MKFSRRQTFAGLGLLGLAAAASQVIGPGSTLAPGRSRARATQTKRRPPGEADVVVIGGGDIGAASAYYLAKAGHKVVLCEKGMIGAEASCRSVGHVFSLGSEPASVALAAASKRLWAGLNTELGIETGFRQDGLVMEVDGQEATAFWEGWLSRTRELSPEARMLSRKEIATLAPTVPEWRGAIFDPTEGRAEPALVAPAYADAAARLGASIVAPCAVRGVEMSGGRVTGVVTEHGSIKCGSVLLAGGAWSTAFVENLGLRLPIANAFSWCASFYGVKGPPTNGIMNNSTWRRQLDGGFTTSAMEVAAPITPTSLRYLGNIVDTMAVGDSGWTVRPRLSSLFFQELFEKRRWKLDEVTPFERRRILEPTINRRVLGRALDMMRDRIPTFANLRVRDMWGGVLSTPPDSAPVIGPVSSHPGLYIATGFPDGLTVAPAVGSALAALTTGGHVDADLIPYRFDRFAT